jgi:Flp pilus assembly pilin Flp
MKYLRPFLRRFRRDDSGAATVEFVIIAPLVFVVVFSVFESGWLMTQYMMLDRGLDLAVRDVRLGIDPEADHDSIRDAVCENAHILKDCRNSLVLEMIPIASAADVPSTTAPCVDRSSDDKTVTTFSTGTRSAIMYVRACAIIDPIFPGMGLGLQLNKDATGGYALLASAAFVNEPE